MRKKALLGLLAIPMALLLSSCFVLQSFVILANSIAPGGKTKVVFTLHAATTTTGLPLKQFVVVGVPDGGDLAAKKTTWGRNGTYGGPYRMPANAALPAALAASSDCDGNGFDFAAVTGVTWKAYVTPTNVNDRGKVNKDVVVQTGIRAVPGATSDTSAQILGVSGGWQDDGDGIPEPGDDAYNCGGFGMVNLHVR